MIKGPPGRRMPPEGNPLNSGEISTIERWVDEGARNSAYGRALERYYAAKKASNWHDALAACNQIGSMKIRGVPTADIATKSRLIVFEANGDEPGWYATAAKVVDMKPLNATLLSDVAWRIVDPHSKLKRRDVSLGFKAASLAVRDTQRKSGAILDTLAWAYYWRGDKSKATATDTEALKCDDAKGETRKSIEESLRAFASK